MEKILFLAKTISICYNPSIQAMVMDIERFVGETFDPAGLVPAAQRLRNVARELYRDNLIPNEIKEKIFRHPRFSYYPKRGTVVVEEEEKKLTKTEDKILRLLTNHPNRVVTYHTFQNAILAERIDPAVTISDAVFVRELSVFVFDLRHKLEPGTTIKKSCIRSRYGIGYFLSDVGK
jgi:DNA-binding response OmpR family regulator